METDPDKVSFRVSNLDVVDAYHRGTLHPSQVGSFAYAIPSAANGNCIIVCANMVLPMRWGYLTKFFFLFSETITGVADSLVHTSFPVLCYGAISKIPDIGPGPPHTLDSLTHIDCYMDDVITAVQGVPEQQRQVFMALSGTLIVSSHPLPTKRSTW